MSQLHLPEGIEAGFRLVYTDAFGWRFSINVYGAGRRGWFVASRRDVESRDSGWQELNKGDWATFLHMIDVSGFWGLPEQFPDPPNAAVDDGDSISLEGRDGQRYHCIGRFVWRERGLDTIHIFLRRLSGLFPPLPPHSEPQVNEDGTVGLPEPEAG
jgi:hypothetical protein